MEPFRNRTGISPRDIQHIQVYDRTLQLVYSGQFTREQESLARKLLQDCSLLFDVRNTSYYLRNH